VVRRIASLCIAFALIPLLVLSGIPNLDSRAGTLGIDDELNDIQGRLVSGFAAFTLGKSGNDMGSSHAGATSYFTRGSDGCPNNTSSNIKVNQNCLNLSDRDLQGRAQAQNESFIKVDPNNQNHIVASYNDYRRGDGTCGVSYSLDGGRTWNDSTVPNGLPVASASTVRICRVKCSKGPKSHRQSLAKTRTPVKNATSVFTASGAGTTRRVIAVILFENEGDLREGDATMDPYAPGEGPMPPVSADRLAVLNDPPFSIGIPDGMETLLYLSVACVLAILGTTAIIDRLTTTLLPIESAPEATDFIRVMPESFLSILAAMPLAYAYRLLSLRNAGATLRNKAGCSARSIRT